MSDEPISGVGSGGPVLFKADKDASLHFWPYAKMSYGESNVQTHITEANGLPVRQSPFAATLAIGRAAVGLTAAALSTVSCRRVRIKASNDLPMDQKIVIGHSAGVTLTTGYTLLPGEVLMLEISNLNLIFAISSTATNSELEYIAEV